MERNENNNSLKLYLHDIGNYPLLTASEEVELGSIIQDKYASEDEKKEAKERMINCNLKLVVNVAKKFKNNSVSLLDLISEGNIGLIKAVEGYDPSYGYRFSTYAVYWIKQAITKSLTDNSRAIRLPAHVYQLLKKYNTEVDRLQHEKQMNLADITDELVAANLNVDVEKIHKLHMYDQHMVSFDTPLTDDEDSDTVGDLIADANTETPDKFVEKNEQRDAIQEGIETLPERTQKIIRMRYGLGREGVDPDEFLTEHTLEEVGAYIGLTRERVRQIEKEALIQLKNTIDKEI